MEEFFDLLVTNFDPILESRFIKKGTILSQHNTLCYDMYLVKSGILRSYYLVDGKDVTSHFAMEFGVVGAADSIIKNKKSRYAIEALEDSHVYFLDYRDLEPFLDENPLLERLARKLSQILYIELVERLEEMTFLTSKQRYESLTKKFPNITQRVNLGHVASFLGITQETLSRVRGK